MAIVKYLFRQRRVAALVAVVGLVPCSCPVAAQDAVVATAAASGPNPEQGIPIEGWMVYPSFFVGAVFNDNVYSSPFNRRSAVGVRVRPSLEANVDNGLHKTTAYFTADAQLYPGLGAETRFYPTPTTYVAPTNVTGRVGIGHIWTPLSDLSVYFTADYTRQSGLFGSNFGAGAPSVYIPGAYTVSGAQQYANQFTGSLAVEKKFSNWFVRGTTGARYVSYDSRPSSFSSLFGGAASNGYAQDGLSYTASFRGGVWVTPQVYAFVEPGVDLRRYQYSISDTNGYRVVGGLGSDLISLFRGEVYGGYQGQSSVSGLIGGSISRPTYGARLFYYPTPFFTLTASVDQTLAAAAAPSPIAAVLGRASTGSQNLQVRVQGDYAFSPYWTAFVRGGYGETRWTNSTRVNTAWVAGVGVSYTFWRNIAITLDYQFTHTGASGGSLFDPLNLFDSSAWGYAQNVVSAGFTYRY